MFFGKQLLAAATITFLLSLTGCGGSDASSESVTVNEESTSSGGNSSNDGDTSENSGDNVADADDSSDSGSDNTGSGDTGNAGTEEPDSPGDDSNDAANPLACQNTTQLGQSFQTAQGSDSDPVFHSDLAADGCLDASSVWSGESGDVLVLDTGTPQPMQGIYIWPRYNQLNWIEVSTSVNGTNWIAEWQAIPTRPEYGPQYLSFKSPRSLRWVRIKSLKGQINDWVNISEVRWSLTGESVSVPKALRFNDGPDMETSRASRLDLAAWSTHPRLSFTQIIAETNMAHENCPFLNTDFPEQSPLYVWVDLHGLQKTAFEITKLPGGIIAFSYDWSHHNYPEDYNVDPNGAYGPTATPKDGSASAATQVMNDQFYAWYDINYPDGPSEQELHPAFCLGTSGHGDLWFGPAIGRYEVLEGNVTPDYSAFR